MEKKIRVAVLRTAGTNCDVETAFAFKIAGSYPELIHINRFIDKSEKLDKFHILAIPGGFTYGDDISSGKILANEIRYKLGNEIMRFIKDGKLIIGICNGFQVLVKAGLLPNTMGTFREIEATLTINDSGRFEDRWVYLKKIKNEKCVWTKNIDRIIYLPVAHAEGKFIPLDTGVVKNMERNKQIVFMYCNKNGNKNGYPWNPNGSYRNIAGICDKSGRIFGLMPHPERHIYHTQHPQWTRIRKRGNFGDGIIIFRNGVYTASKL